MKFVSIIPFKIVAKEVAFCLNDEMHSQTKSSGQGEFYLNLRGNHLNADDKVWVFEAEIRQLLPSQEVQSGKDVENEYIFKIFHISRINLGLIITFCIETEITLKLDFDDADIYLADIRVKKKDLFKNVLCVFVY